MTAKKNSTRNSTAAQRVNSIYRRQVDMGKHLANIEATMRLDAEIRAANRDTIRLLVDHVTRLTREKETLVKLMGWPEVERRLSAANAFLAKPQPQQPANGRAPVLTAMVGRAAPPPPYSIAHVYDKARERCTRCDNSREAIEASGLFCELMGAV